MVERVGTPHVGVVAARDLAGLATHCDQSVFESPFSTWKPAVDDPHMKPEGNVTCEGGEGAGAGALPEDELQAIRAAAATGKVEVRPRATPRPLPGPTRPLTLRPMNSASYHPAFTRAAPCR